MHSWSILKPLSTRLPFPHGAIRASLRDTTARGEGPQSGPPQRLHRRDPGRVLKRLHAAKPIPLVRSFGGRPVLRRSFEAPLRDRSCRDGSSGLRAGPGAVTLPLEPIGRTGGRVHGGRWSTPGSGKGSGGKVLLHGPSQCAGPAPEFTERPAVEPRDPGRRREGRPERDPRGLAGAAAARCSATYRYGL